MSKKDELQKRVIHLEQRISQLMQFGYEEEVIIRKEDLAKLKMELADIELKELVDVVEEKPKKKTRKKKVVKEEG